MMFIEFLQITLVSDPFLQVIGKNFALHKDTKPNGLYLLTLGGEKETISSTAAICENNEDEDKDMLTFVNDASELNFGLRYSKNSVSVQLEQIGKHVASNSSNSSRTFFTTRKI